MPKRTDIKKILLIGSGPIIIGQACEFDYSGTQACKALREEGYTVVLVNSNPATIMTDPETADRTYIEPITWEVVEKIIAAERPDALLPTLGGQTALNTAMDLFKRGVLAKYGVEMIGADADVIDKAEDRQRFKDAVLKIGVAVPKSVVVHTLEEAMRALDEIGLPCVLRPSFTMGGSGGGIAYNRDEYRDIITHGLALSPTTEVLVEESVIGWKEYELEVMRDKADNVVIICSIENLDPMGVHTGDSITVAPAQTLSDKEYQRMRDKAKDIIREIGVETGGSNIQFAINPADGRMIVIEMNPRVSRSSALASKATGFPIAKIAAKLAVGYTLDELKNDITRETPACFEPTIDYVVTKVPRFAFEKFPEANATLTTQMKSVGETMAIGRTFKESLQKALRGLEVGRFGLGCDKRDRWGTPNAPSLEEITVKLSNPNADRIWYVRYAMLAGMTVEEIHQRSRIDPWFLRAIRELVDVEGELRGVSSLDAVTPELMLKAKQHGFIDRQLAALWQVSEAEVRKLRTAQGVTAVFKSVDTCAAEFEAYTPYYYSTYEAGVRAQGSESGVPTGSSLLPGEDEVRPGIGKPRIMILGGGPNRIGQGIEFDYCCCQAAFALRARGYEVIMVNSNPETVSTDYDTSDHLFFEPLTPEDVINIHERMKPEGVIVQFGGQTPLNLATPLQSMGVPIIGTSVDSIDIAENRERFARLVTDLGLLQPANGTAVDEAQALRVARKIGFPILVRPSFVLGGRDMKIVYNEDELTAYIRRVEPDLSRDRPVLIDQFLENATEVDVDCLSDGTRTVIGGVMQHIEEAGIHSGDSACVIPPYSLPATVINEIKVQTRKLAAALNVKGLMNIQFAVAGIRGGVTATEAAKVYILEANPRASRTIPFVSKATGVPLARLAALVMVGKTLDELGVKDEVIPTHYSIKESVFPFNKFPGVDIILGPEMKSTGEVMGIDDSMPMAFAKAQLAASSRLPEGGTVFISVANRDKDATVPIARGFAELGFRVIATRGTAAFLRERGVPVEDVPKIAEGRPNLLDHMKNGSVQLIINTPTGRGSSTDESRIRAEAVASRVTAITTISAAQAAVEACRALKQRQLTVTALQDRFPTQKAPGM
ncbi:Carbamoyl-phosphate synthase large chain [Gemmata obscuriglobus]|uniref:Carbamoyl phosphate synthase large chain n=1 Tax=Gemmata obscuriglobus TaxID=114 RepID=A0A2Z3H2S5_9BACT|nr:carbamoyl-phosphate synthase large subunit [Gemmata obscuriglobus]AWM38622.1 carbamoyl-phosphate synthase large subunit [Gemmata obscuriglobus]QEG28420.1 Carbamoyl-phosphate synthase large chain [Gemmata obscuriglobus]VTS06377.1 carbamoyl phosphate synthase large subunit : Carbamoyl-phosphate synthase (glutamine-hydrolyzing) OS=Pirellula staleyi (strain ATCC 27377 / DSM 6068 / ICPB 4128) GN=Psta_1525 PE=3 SV=1: CPSase_L_chain: CPSase_L_D2: CPSase_L_D3: CPSase_L_chain: CPSase_L_D2: MGS [Gemmat